MWSITSSRWIGEPVDVLTVERRHERRVDPAHDLVRDLVAVVLGLADPFAEALALIVVQRTARSRSSAAFWLFRPA